MSIERLRALADWCADRQVHWAAQEGDYAQGRVNAFCEAEYEIRQSIAELGQEVGAVAWQKSFTVEMDNHHPHPYGIAVITDTDGRQSVYSHGEDQVLWHLLNALAREGEA